MTTRPGFTIWDVSNVDLPLAESLVQPDLEYASIRRGAKPGEGPGLVVNSYDPSLLIRLEEHPTHGPVPGSLRSAVGLAGNGVVELARVLANLEGVSVREIAERIFPDLTKYYALHDYFMHIDETFVPAVRLDLGVPDLVVIVSANLLTHPVQVTAWQCQMRPYPSLTSTAQPVPRTADE